MLTTVQELLTIPKNSEYTIHFGEERLVSSKSIK